VIDPGCSRAKLNKTLRQNGIEYSNLKYAYITHGHSDHVVMLNYIQEKNPKIETYIHALDREYVENPMAYITTLFDVAYMEHNEKYKYFIDAINFYMTHDPTIQVKDSFKMVFDTWDLKERKIDHTFKDGDFLPGDLKVILAPGHTPGMCLFFNERDEILFSADIHLSSVGANYNGTTANLRDFKNSINTISKMVDNGIVNMILSGHGKNPIKEDLNGRLSKFYDSIADKEEQILGLLRDKNEMTIEEITEETYKIYMKRFDRYLDAGHMQTYFQETIIIAEASELISNLNVLKELERLNKVKKASSETGESWVLT
jgi:glyoxylase-like metal-dependent hydrolase (beta-lactamase superfamily II)